MRAGAKTEAALSGAVNVTVMFTDLVGSTAMASRVGPEAAERLRREHFGILRECVAHQDGREVKNLGDGLLVVFDRPSASVAAGVEMHQQLERRNRRAPDDEALIIRVGIAAGEADTDEDGDVFGPPVVEASRLCESADGGQVLTSEVVRALVAGRGGFDFQSLGVRPLKGLDEKVAVCEVGWDPLEDPLPPAGGVPLPRRLARPAPVFVGRVHESGLLDELLRSSAAGTCHGAVIAGEAGIGKTTLVADFAARANGAGAAVAYGRCDEDLGVAFQPWIESLAHLVEHLPVGVLDDHVASRGGALVRLAPELERRIPVPAAQPSADAEVDRYLLFGAVADLLARAATAQGPVIVVLDDLHWADRPTLQLLKFVLDAAVEGLLVLATYRPTDVDASHPLPEALAGLARLERTAFIDLHGLDDADLLELIAASADQVSSSARASSDVDEALRDALVAETAGNPFFAVEILRHLVETGVLTRGSLGRWSSEVDLRETGLPVSVRQVIEQRVAGTGERAERLLRQAAVIGREFDLDLLEEISRVDPDDLLDVLDAAVKAELVMNVEGERFGFSHALIERALYEDLTPARRARTHERIAAVLEERVGDDPGRHVGEIARHWTAAVGASAARKAVEWNRRAGDHALDQLAPDEAIGWYERALGLLDDGPDDPRSRCRVLVGLGIAERDNGRASHRERLLVGAHLAHAIGDSEMLVAAALANSRGWFSDMGGVDADRLEVLELALAAVPADDLQSRARLLATTSAELTWSDWSRHLALADEAVEVARRSGDDHTICDVLRMTDWSPRFQGPWRLAEHDRSSAEALALAGDDPVRRHYGLLLRWRTLLRLGDGSGVEACVEEAERIAARLGRPRMHRNTLGARALLAQFAGDMARAEALVAQLFEIDEELGQPDATASYGIRLMGMRLNQGRLGELTDLIAAAAQEAASASLPIARDYVCALAAAHAQSGDRGAARRILDEVDVDGVRQDGTWSTVMALLADTALMVGDRGSAAAVFERLEPFADQTSGITDITCEGSIAHRLGCLAAFLGRTDEAIGHLEAGLDANRRLGSRIHVAASATELARLVSDPDPTRARALEGEAEELRGVCGLESWPGATGRWWP